MADVAIDANVLVGVLDRHDTLHASSVALLERLEDEQRQILLLDVCVAEAVSVLCRRATQRKTNPPDLSAALEAIRAWVAQGIQISFVQAELDELLFEILTLVEAHGGAINFNDAFLVLLQRMGRIGEVASFDRPLDEVPGFKRVE